MSRVSILFLSAIAFGLAAAPADLFAQDTCFTPADSEKEVCVDFKKSWYIFTIGGSHPELRVRDMGSPAPSHIWNRGQYQLTQQEFEKLRTALRGQGLPLNCPHEAFRMPANTLKTRAEYCR